MSEDWLPPGESWLGIAGHDVSATPDGLAFSAGPCTDWFRDPRTGTATANAPVAVLVRETWPVTVSCRVAPSLVETFDAAALFVHYDDQHWIKFAVERSPDGRPTIVSVRTDMWSDDCNHTTVPGHACRLRASIDDRSVALHASLDPAGVPPVWELVRYCAHPVATPPSVGLLVQSPTGAGATGTFTDVRIEHATVLELRDGS